MNLAYLNVFVHAVRVLKKGDGEREEREEGFQHKPPFIDTIENINMSSTKTVERWHVDSECRKQERRKERKKESVKGERVK